jgi:alpha-glucosidase
LLRWVQFGIFMPRFSIHSWNEDKSVNEPWMYPETTPYIRDLIKFRYRLIPYLYDLLWRSHRYYTPIIRPTFYEFPEDECCYAENDDMLLGENLLVVPVVEPEERARSVYLPAGCGWYDFWSGDYYHGGQEIVLPAPWDRPPLLAREGCAIPLNVAEQHFLKRSDQRGFCIFPYRGDGQFEYRCFEDDGESEGHRHGHYWTWRLQVTTSRSDLFVKIEREGEDYRKTGQVSLLFPRQDTRRVEVRGGSVVAVASGAFNRELLIALDDLE